MEYLMTYGWAILVVMVVGVAMWQLGMFNMGGATTPTSSGFEALKPLVATCEVKADTWWPGAYNGFACQFVNSAGTTITIKDINATANNKYGFEPHIDVNPIASDASHIVYRLAYTPDSYFGPMCYIYNPSPGHHCDSMGTNTWLDFPPDSQFTVNLLSMRGDGTVFGVIQPGVKYDIYIDITYDVAIGGVTSTKHSTGHVYVTSTK